MAIDRRRCAREPYDADTAAAAAFGDCQRHQQQGAAGEEQLQGDDGVATADALRVLSRVNTGVRAIDDLVADDESDELVEQLNLHGNFIESMDGLEAFSGVVELCLSNNFIQEISFSALEQLVHLRILDLSANSITSTLGFPQLPRLEELSLAHNSIKALDGLTRPIKFPKLRYLDLRQNDITDYYSIISLQHHKRLTQLRLQAHDGSQINPVCELDDYTQTVIKMLPRLTYLDEEEVSLLKEVGNLYMPKYQSILRRIKRDTAAAARGNQDPQQSPNNSTPGKPRSAGRRTPGVTPRGSSQQAESARQAPRGSAASHYRDQPSQLAPIQTVVESTERRGFMMLTSPRRERAQPTGTVATQNQSLQIENLQMPSPIRSTGDAGLVADRRPEQQIGSPSVRITQSTPQEPNVQRILTKEAATNTDFDFEKEILRREQAIIQKENEMLAKEKERFSKESESFVKEKELSAQITNLQEELSVAIVRATKAEMVAEEANNQLTQREQDQVRSHEASATADEQRLQTQTKQQTLLESELAALKESHRLELEQLKTIESNLMRKIDIMQDKNEELVRVMQDKENELRAKEVALIRSEAKVGELTVSLERAVAEQNNVAQRLSSEVQNHKDRHEQTEKRNLQLELQVKELKSNVEAVYNKCIEKDEDIHRLKRTLLSKSEDIEDLKAQHVKTTDRAEKMAQQQNELYKQRLETSIAQIEMEFRKEHYHSMSKLQLLQKKYQEISRHMAQLKEAYQMSLKREADAQSEISRLQAILEDDKRKMFMEDTKRADKFKVTLKNLSDEVTDLKTQLDAAKEKNDKLKSVEAATEELRATNGRLRAEMAQQASEIEALKKLEDDLQAAIKAKDVMLDHQQTQISQLRKEKEGGEQQLQDEILDLQGQVEDLEMALDENIQKVMDLEARQERHASKLHEKERALQVKVQEIDDLSHELGKKHGALELIETEMERMRDVLNDQNALFQKRLEKYLEQHKEELERVKIGAEESRELLRIQWEGERRDMMQRYASVSSDLKDVAAQNAKLRVSVDFERKRNAQSDQEMRVLLAQIDRERHLKKENLKHIKSLFEQLQQESP